MMSPILGANLSHFVLVTALIVAGALLLWYTAGRSRRSR
jgi:hypothetical protein